MCKKATHDSVLNVLSLANHNLDSFVAIWYTVFLWALFSSMFVHITAAFVAFFHLRKHHIGRWITLIILAMGIISPLTGGVVTSAAIAGVVVACNFTILPLWCLVCGVGQTFFVVFISFTRIVATL